MTRWLVLFIILFHFSANAQEYDLHAYVLRHAKEIDSSSHNFSGLNFLDTILQNKRIVLLGESSHGTEEYSQVKLQLIQYLHEKLGYNVLLFESPMMPGTYVNIAADSITSSQLVANTIQSVWHTNTVSRLFDYIREKNICFSGFDPQFLPSPYSRLLVSNLFGNDPVIRESWLMLEQKLSATFHHPNEYLSQKKAFASSYAQLNEQLNQRNLYPTQLWMRQMTAVSTGYYLNITKGTQRDRDMAKNIQWLADSLYPHEKIIVWAHNTHIDKMSTTRKREMGKLLDTQFGKQLFVIGLYMANGKTALNNREIISVKEPLPGSIEEALLKTGNKRAFIETKDPLFDKLLPTWHWGKDRQYLRLSESYDAVILVNGVKPPSYIQFP
jgi:erythromycin esterase